MQFKGVVINTLKLMRFIKLGISNIKPAKLLLKAQVILTQMTGNPHFPNPTPSLTEFEVAVNELDSAIQIAATGLKQGILIRKDKEEHLKKLIRQMAAYVSLVAKGDGSILIQSGFELQREPRPVAEVSQPIEFKAVRYLHEGSVKLSWKAVKGARMYVVAMTTADPSESDNNWKITHHTTKVRAINENLVLGQYYWFRVKAYGRKGEGPWSDVSLVMAA